MNAAQAQTFVVKGIPIGADYMLTASDYSILHKLVLADGYPGYKPEVVESPNGDGKLDSAKQYSHVAEKYLKTKTCKEDRLHWNDIIRHNENIAVLNGYLDKAHDLATQVAISIGVPPQFWPSRKESALRVLEYGPMAVSHEHTDFDLFTLSLYRNLPTYFKRNRPVYKGEPNNPEERYKFAKTCLSSDELKAVAESLNPQVHFGELLQEIDPQSYVATPHEVQATNGPWQYSVVYFAVPSSDSVLPSGMTVGKWMDIRKGKSRYER